MGAQYFSWVRGNRLLVRGERGEIEGDTVRWLHDFRTPIALRLAASRHWLFAATSKGCITVATLPGPNGSIATRSFPVASPMTRWRWPIVCNAWQTYVAGGAEFYGLADAAHDHYLNLLMGQAAESGKL